MAPLQLELGYAVDNGPAPAVANLSGSLWRQSHRADKRAIPLADRHYNRQKIGSPQFVPPGSCLVLLTSQADALWVTSWPKARYVKHQWAGAWVCSCFRNESRHKASDLITEAVMLTAGAWPKPPEVWSIPMRHPYCMVTFINYRHVRPTMVRGRAVWGWTYRKADFEEIGHTKGGLLALGLATDRLEAIRA